jgi:Flp pilus assembly protein TadD
MRVLLEQAVAAQPGHARARRMLADALLLAGEAAASESAYTAALAITDDDSRVHGGLGLLLLTQGRFDESIPHLERAIAIGPDDASFRINLGAALVRKGDLTGAATQFERALVLEPSNADAQRNLATIRGALAARSPSPFTSTPADSAAAAR